MISRTLTSMEAWRNLKTSLKDFIIPSSKMPSEQSVALVVSCLQLQEKQTSLD